jgi:hypothetical protein
MTQWQGSNAGGGETSVFRTAEVLAFDRTAAAPLDVDRFEFARRDPGLNVVAFGPLTASRQWPQAPVPAERRIRFRQWEQR